MQSLRSRCRPKRGNPNDLAEARRRKLPMRPLQFDAVGAADGAHNVRDAALGRKRDRQRERAMNSMPPPFVSNPQCLEVTKGFVRGSTGAKQRHAGVMRARKEERKAKGAGKRAIFVCVQLHGRRQPERE